MPTLQEGLANDAAKNAEKAMDRMMREVDKLVEKCAAKPYTEQLIEDANKLIKNLKGRKTKLVKLRSKSQ